MPVAEHLNDPGGSAPINLAEDFPFPLDRAPPAPFDPDPETNVVHFRADQVPEHLYEAPPWGDEIAATPCQLRATPFVWRDENEIPARQWLYGKHLLRKFVSVDVAAGGVGKSSVKIGEALAMASDRPLYGRAIHGGPLTVWLYNLEDPQEETERRLHATAKWFKIAPEEVAGRLYVDSGRDQRCVIASEGPHGTMIAAPLVAQLKQEIQSRGIDVLIIDPFVSSHEVSENDNRAIDQVAKEWGRIADECNCSINLVHHVRKGNGAETNTDSARGAKALTDAARSVIVYNRMTEEEASAAGVPQDQKGFYFRTQNDKANLAPPENAEWFRMNNVDLANGDQVGVACPWTWPELFDGISMAKVREVQNAVDRGRFRKDSRAGDWVGFKVASILGVDPEDHKQRIISILKEWFRNGLLEEAEEEDEHRHVKKFVRVGKWLDS